MEHTQEMNVTVHLHKFITAKVNLPLFKKNFFYLVKYLKRNGYQTCHMKIRILVYVLCFIRIDTDYFAK
jgi:hypothetical protein